MKTLKKRSRFSPARFKSTSRERHIIAHTQGYYTPFTNKCQILVKERNEKEKDIVEEIVKERVKENEELFTMEELKFIKDNSKILKKVYLLGLVNGKNVYEIK